MKGLGDCVDAFREDNGHAIFDGWVGEGGFLGSAESVDAGWEGRERGIGLCAGHGGRRL